MKLSVINKSGKDTGREVELSDAIFSAEPNDHAIYLDVKQYLANQRQGTHKSKEKWEITGSTRKLKRQKGTGTARAGSIKSPLFKGGGRVFGPKPRNYGFKLNKKTKELARISALSYKAKDKKLTVLEDLEFKAPKTTDFANVLKGLKLTDTKTLLLVADKNDNVYLSSRNIKKAEVLPVSEINTYALLNADTVILSEGAVKSIEESLNK